MGGIRRNGGNDIAQYSEASQGVLYHSFGRNRALWLHLPQSHHLSNQGEEMRIGIIKPEKKTCTCNFCTVIYPAIKRIEAELTGQNLIDFEMLMTNMMCAEEDAGYANAKLDGSWPGWEFMKDLSQRPDRQGIQEKKQEEIR